MANVIEIVVKATDEFSQSMGKFNKTIKKAETDINKVGRSFTVVGAIITASLGVIIKSAGDFALELAVVNTQLDEQTSNLLPKFRDQLLDISSQFGQSTATLSKGLFDILSASIPAEQAMDVLTVSVIAATAGITNTAIAADAITTILNSYGLAAERAGDVSDFLFATVKRGKTTFAELSPTIGGVASLAATAGLSLEEMGASLATMTRAGISTDQAVTSLRATMNAFLKPSNDAQKAAKELGVELSSSTLRTEGLLSVVNKLSGASTEQAARIFGSIRAFKGMATILQQTEGFMFDVDFITNRTGKTQEAFNKIAIQFNFTMARLGKTFGVIFKELGSTVLPTINKMANAIIFIAKQTIGWIRENKELIKTVLIVTGIIGGLLVVLGPILLSLAGLVGIVAALTPAFGALAAAFGFISSPLILMIAGVVGIITVIVLLAKNFKGLLKVAENVFGRMADLFSSIADAGKGVVLIFTGKFKEGFKAIGDATVDLKDKIVENFNDGKDVVIEVAKNIKDNFAETLENMSGNISDFTEGMKNAFDETIPEITDIVQEATDVWAEGWELFTNKIITNLEIVQTLYENVFGGLTDLLTNTFVEWAKGNNSLVGSLKEAWSGFRSFLIEAVFRALSEKIAALIIQGKVLKTILSGGGGLIGGILGGIGSIFGFAHGGIVTSPTLGILGEAGPEAVIPLSSGRAASAIDSLGGGGSRVDIGNIIIQFPNVTSFQDWLDADPEMIKEITERKLFDAFQTLADEGRMTEVVS